MRLLRHTYCARWLGLGAVLGLSAVAWAADPVVIPEALADPVLSWLVDLALRGGLPAILAVLGWWARGQVHEGIVVRLSDEDRALLRASTATVRADTPPRDRPD